METGRVLLLDIFFLERIIKSIKLAKQKQIFYSKSAILQLISKIEGLISERT